MIDSANAWAANWAPVLWRASWQGSLFILAVWAICKTFPRIPAASRHWLWWLASAQLLIRIAFATPIALPLLPAQSAIDRASIAVEASVSEVTQPVVAVSPAPVRLTEAPPQPRPGPSLPLIAMSAWMLGLLACCANLTKRLVKSRSYLQGRSLFNHNELTDLVEELSAEIGVKPPSVRESRKAPCPLLVGWLKPTIVLPSGAIDSFTAVELRMAIAHELIHLKRRDLWLALAPDTAQVLFFFHPLAWLAANETAAAREEACDSEALRLSGGSLATYARLLLNSAQSGSSAAVMGAAIGYRLIQRRINMLKSSTPGYGPFTRRALTGVIALAALCALPWTVTAQSSAAAGSTAAATQPHRVAKKHAKRFAKHASSKAAAKKPSKLETVRKASFATAGTKTKDVYYKVFTGVKYGSAWNPAVGASASSGVRAGASSRPAGNTAMVGTTSTSRGSSVTFLNTGSATTNGSTSSAAPRATSSSYPSTGTVSTGSTNSAAAEEPQASSDNGRVSLEFDKVQLRDAIRLLFKQARMDYTVRSDVTDDTVTISIHHGEPMDILIAILKSVKQQLTYRVERDVVQIIPKEGN